MTVESGYSSLGECSGHAQEFDLKAVNDVWDRMRWPKNTNGERSDVATARPLRSSFLPLSLRRPRLHPREFRTLRAFFAARNVVPAIATASTAFIASIVIFIRCSQPLGPPKKVH